MENGLTSANWSAGFAKSLNNLFSTEGADQVKILSSLDKFIKLDSFIYENAEDERLGKTCLLDLWMFLLASAYPNPEHLEMLEKLKRFKNSRRKTFRGVQSDSVKLRLVRKAYQLMPHLARRREFDLIHVYPCGVNITQGHRQAIFSTHLTSDENLQIVQRYRSYLIITLKFSFKALKVPSAWHKTLLPTISEASQRQLIERLRDLTINALVIAFFTIPLLCGPLVDILAMVAPTATYIPDSEMKDDDKVGIGLGPGRNSPKWLQTLSNDVRDWVNQVTEKRSKSHKLITTAEKTSKSAFIKSNPNFFEWTRPELTQHNLEGDAAVISEESLKRIKQLFTEIRTFFLFVYLWLSYVTRNCIGVTQWSCIPGYWLVVQCFLNRFMMEDVRYLGDESVRGSANLILTNRYCNACLNFFARAMLNITNLYNKEDFNFSIDVLDSWLSIVDGSPENLPEGVASQVNMATPIPESFCFDMFFEVFEILLNYDHFQIVLKTLAFLYMHMDRFYGARRVRLFDMLLDEELFYSLCLHWHPEVRHTFLYMLVYRLNRRGLHPQKSQHPPVTAHTIQTKSAQMGHALSHLNLGVKEFRDEEMTMGMPPKEKEKKADDDEAPAAPKAKDPKDVDEVLKEEKMETSSRQQKGLFKKIGQKFSNIFGSDKTAAEEDKEEPVVPKGDNRHVLIPDEDPSFERCVLVVSYLSLKETRTEGKLRTKFRALVDKAYEQYYNKEPIILPKKHIVYLEAALCEYEKIVPSYKRLQLVHDDPAKNGPGNRLRGRSRSAVGLSSMGTSQVDEESKHRKTRRSSSPRARGALQKAARKSNMNIESHTRRISHALPIEKSEEEEIRGQVFLPVFLYQITAEKI